MGTLENIANKYAESKTTQYLIIGGVGVGIVALSYIFIARPVMIRLRIVKSRADKKAERLIELEKTKAWWGRRYYLDNQSSLNLSAIQAREIANNMHSSFNRVSGLLSIHNMFWRGDASKGQGAINIIRTRADLSYVSAMYFDTYSRSLLDDIGRYLRGNDIISLIESINRNIR